MGFLEDASEILSDAGVSLAGLTRGPFVDSKINAIALIASGSPQATMGFCGPWDEPCNITVQIRDTDPVVARNRVQDVIDKAYAFAGQVEGGYRYYEIQPSQSTPNYVGEDENGREIYSVTLSFKRVKV
jgi:hypothetical protein